jgi:hypothetical protein
VAVVGSGASAKGVDLSLLRDRIHVIAINNAVHLCPWADMLYACDYNWWLLYRGATDFGGVRISQDVLATTYWPEIVGIEVVPKSDDILTEKFGKVGSGGNGGFQMVNLAVQMGCSGVLLIGFDFGGQHWHGRHLPPCTNPDESNFMRWRGALNGVAPKLARMGVDVVNCSPISTVTAYPKISVPEALERWGLA